MASQLSISDLLIIGGSAAGILGFLRAVITLGDRLWGKKKPEQSASPEIDKRIDKLLDMSERILRMVEMQLETSKLHHAEMLRMLEHAEAHRR